MDYFLDDLSHNTLWRGIILFGRNVASYKFALGKSIIELARDEKTFLSLEELAPVFSQHICEHLKHTPKQITSKGSQFLNACKDFNTGAISHQQLLETTVKKGFQNVIDAFHIVNQGPVPVKFYIDERVARKGINLTDDLLNLANSSEAENLLQEVEARWRLVETAWSLGVAPRLMMVSREDDRLIYSDANRRIDISSSRDSLNGYQKGRCFYCDGMISLENNSENFCDVDHLLPHMLCHASPFKTINIDGVWNLCLSCRDCNRGEGGKSSKVPHIRFLKKLHQRNEYYIRSHHPLRETIKNQTGETEKIRQRFLTTMYKDATALLGCQFWEPQSK